MLEEQVSKNFNFKVQFPFSLCHGLFQQNLFDRKMTVREQAQVLLH